MFDSTTGKQPDAVRETRRRVPAQSVSHLCAGNTRPNILQIAFNCDIRHPSAENFVVLSSRLRYFDGRNRYFGSIGLAQ